MNNYLSKRFLLALITSSFVLLCACTPSHMVCSWNYPSLNLTHYKKVLVIGLFGDKDADLRQDMELDMAESLNAHGMKTHSAFERFGATSFQEKDARPALSELKDSSYDAVVCLVLVDREKEKKYISPIVNNYTNYNNYNNFSGPYFNAYNGFQNYYNQSYSKVYNPGYYKSTSQYIVEVIVFNFPKDSILYYAETETKNPKMLEDLSTYITKEVTQDMVKKKALPELKK
jgi:hypothetical protein